MENIRGWLVLAFTEEQKQSWALLHVKGLAAGERPMEVIPILTTESDANLIAAHCWESNDNIKDIAIVDVSSLFKNNKPILKLISRQLDKSEKKWYQFWR